MPPSVSLLAATMTWKRLGLAIVLVAWTLGSVGLAAANHPEQDCSQLDNALDAINESADDAAEENNAVDRAKDECEGNHHQDEANDGGDNGDPQSENAN